MKPVYKRVAAVLFRTVPALVLWAAPAFAHAQDDCYVRYKYDAAGNRIQRYWYCVGHDNGQVKSKHADGPLSGNGLTVYPVPAKDLVTLRLQSSVENATVEVLDDQGKVLIRGQFNSNLYELNVTSLSNGYYQMRVMKDEDYFLSSFTVVH